MLAKVASWMIARQHGAVMYPPVDLHANLQRLKELSKQMPQYPTMRRIEDKAQYQEFKIEKGYAVTKSLFDVPGVASCAHTILEPNTEFPTHRHKEEEILIVIKGSLLVSGDDNVYMLAPGGVAILQPNTKHSAITTSGCEFIIVTVPDSPDFPRKYEETTLKDTE